MEEAKQEALRKDEVAWGLESEDLELHLSLFYQGAEVESSWSMNELRNSAGERSQGQAQEVEEMKRPNATNL